MGFPLSLLLFLLFTTFSINAQTTNIPDPNFERALIDLEIDSDGTINGQVWTSDIALVTTLNLDHRQIQDLTGLEDFGALEVLNANGNLLTTLDISQNVQLKELYCSSDSAGFNMMISTLDIENNANLEVLYGENLIYLESLNLKNGSNAILTVILPCEFEGFPCQLAELVCVQVDDAVAATNNEPPYDSWSIDAENFIYSENCTLGISSLQNKGFSIHQNPVRENLVLKSAAFTGNAKLILFNAEGRLLNSQNLTFEKQVSLDVTHLGRGLYFLKIQTEDGNVVVKKFLKE